MVTVSGGPPVGMGAERAPSLAGWRKPSLSGVVGKCGFHIPTVHTTLLSGNRHNTCATSTRGNYHSNSLKPPGTSQSNPGTPNRKSRKAASPCCQNICAYPTKSARLLKLIIDSCVHASVHNGATQRNPLAAPTQGCCKEVPASAQGMFHPARLAAPPLPNGTLCAVSEKREEKGESRLQS